MAAFQTAMKRLDVEEAAAILRERFARGDITLDEFEAAKRALGYPSSLTPPPLGPGTPPLG